MKRVEKGTPKNHENKYHFSGFFSHKKKKEKHKPPLFLLTQARIAALAFEVLYEKDPVESLEELVVDKERPGLRYKLTQAIKGVLRMT